MRRILFVTALVSLFVAACAPVAPTEEPAFIIERPAATPLADEPTPAEQLPTEEQVSAGPVEEAVVERLAANLRLRESDVSILSSEAVEFSDACMGMALENIPCAQVTTPGYLIVAEANNMQYEYRASRDGARLQPATIALTWKREGGIAGFCDTLTVFLSGEVFASPCPPETPEAETPDVKTGTFANLLSTSEKAKLNGWITRLAQANLDDSDPQGVSDRMVVTLTLYGNGGKPPTDVEQRELFKFAQDLYDKLSR